MIMLQKPISVILLTGLISLSLCAQQPGSLDPTFDDDGIKLTPIGTANAFGRSMVIQPDGKIVVACIGSNGTDTDFAIARYTTQGDPDISMNGDGIVMTDFDGRTDIAEDIALDEFNRIIVAGSVDSGDGFGFAVARYLSDGTLDETFGDSGLVTKMIGITGFCKSVAVQHDNKIVLGGYVLDPVSQTNEFVMMRLNTDGTPDSTFHNDGIVKTNMEIGAGVANALLIQPDKKILLVGQVLNDATLRWQIGMARYNEDGSMDNTWDEDGLVFTGMDQADFTINEVVMDDNKKIVVGGYFGTAPSNNLFAVVRYHLDGTLDETFGDEGILLDSYGAQNNQVNTIVIQPDGQILIAGSSLQGNRDLFAIARLDADGEFDESFGEQGVVRPVIDQNDGINAMVLQQDGKLVVAGESFNGQRFSIALARIETGLVTSADDPAESTIKVSVFPNPVNEELYVSFMTSPTDIVRIVLMDQTGRIVNEWPYTFEQNAGVITVDLAIPMQLPNGVYSLGLMSGDSIRGVQVIVMR